MKGISEERLRIAGLRGSRSAWLIDTYPRYTVSSQPFGDAFIYRVDDRWTGETVIDNIRHGGEANRLARDWNETCLK